MGHDVKVYIYDLSRGLAKSLSSSFLGKQIDGIWHTGIVVYSTEFYFGGSGIGTCPPGGTILKEPDSVVNLGETEIPEDVFLDYLRELADTTFRGQCYNLLEHNCNVFSNEVGEFLTGKSIPSYITNLPKDVLSTPFGAMIRPFLDSMNVDPGNNTNHVDPFSQMPLVSDNATNGHPSTNNERKAEKFDVITYKNPDIVSNFNACKGGIMKKCDQKEIDIVKEIVEFLQNGGKYWSLSVKHIQTVDKIVHENNLSTEEKQLILELIQESLLNEEIISLIIFDSQRSFFKLIEDHGGEDPEVIAAKARLLCNLIANDPGCRAIWPMKESLPCNIVDQQSFVSKFITNGLLHQNEEVVQVSSSIALNALSHQVPEETENNIGFALIEVLSQENSIQTYENCLKCLLLCSNNSEIMGLANVMNLQIHRFESMFENSSQICKELHKKIHKS